MKKLLFMTPHSLNGFSGGAIATRNFLKVARQVFDDTSVVVETSSEEHLINEGISSYHLIKPRRSIHKLYYLLKGESIERFSPGLELRKLKVRNYTHLIIDNSIIGRFARIIKKIHPNIFIITLHHNFDRKFYQDSFSSLIHKVLINRVLDYNQKSALHYSNLNLTFTEQDLLEIENFYGSIESKRKAIFGFFEPTSTNIRESSIKSSNKRLIITGNLSVKKGYVGIISFINDIFIKLSKNAFSLVIAGRNPVTELVQLCSKYDNIEIIANPESMQPLIQDSDIYVNPCFLGSGIKIRNFDGLRYGLPVACHIGNSYGFEHYSDRAFSTFNSKETFLEALDKLSMNKKEIYNEYLSKNSLEAGVKKMRLLINPN